MKRVVIVGAGISGLSTAYRLQTLRPEIDVTVLEADARPGGKIWTEDDKGFRVEIGPNGFLDNKPSTLRLANDLGLAGELCSASESAGRNRFLHFGNGLRKLPSSPFSFLLSPLLSWRAKLALLTERFRTAPPPAGDESIDAFARRRTNGEIAETLADALVTGIYAGDPQLLSMAACFPRIADLDRRYGSIVKGFGQEAKRKRAEAKAAGQPYKRGTKMWSFPKGLRTLVEALVEKLQRKPVLGGAIRRIEKTADSWTVHSDGSASWTGDALVLACPAYAQAELLRNLDPSLAELTGKIPYNKVAVVALGFPKSACPIQPDGFGFIAPQRLRRDVLGVQWCSSIFQGHRAPPDTVLLRGMVGGWNRADMLDWDDARLIQALRQELRIAMKIEAEPTFQKIARWPQAIPQYHVGHLDLVEKIMQQAKRHSRLYLTGNAYHGVSLNDCTEQGEILAGKIAADLGDSLGQTQPVAS